MPFRTDFRSSLSPNTKDSSTQSFSEIPPTPKYPSFRRAIELSNIPVDASKLAGYMRASGADIPLSFASRSKLSSPSPVPRWTSNPRIVPLESIEEYELEDDDAESCPPISSSPGRSSDPFFPSNESFSSPQTSPGAHILEAKAQLDESVSTPGEGDFVSKLQALLAVAAHQRERHAEIDNDIAATLVDRSLSVTPTTPPLRPLKMGRVPSGLELPGEHTHGLHLRLILSPSNRAIAATVADLNRRREPGPLLLLVLILVMLQISTALLLLLKRLPLRQPNSGEFSIALLRKSLSLRSDASNKSSSPPSDDLVSTWPNTPSPPKVKRVVDLASLAIPFDVPIIAPPPEHIARLPLSKETSAKIRIGNFLAREGICRASDKLDGMTVAAAVSTLHAEWEHILGIGPELRNQVVEWILEVQPKTSVYFPPIKTASRHLSRTASDPASSSYSSVDFGEKGVPDLIDQLLCSPETRFHAAYMFIRYFYLVMGHGERREKIELLQHAAAAAHNSMPFDPATQPEGWNLVVWDCCLACLAISVKMHRDVLEPLNPVLSWEYEALAPHDISYRDFEIAQRDVLEVFAYRLGGTPQPILDELWIALPSLRQLLEFKNGWKFAQKQTWWRLFDAVAAPDVLKFPISLLTVAALAEALVAALVSKYEYDATVSNRVTRRRPNKYHSDSNKLCERLEIKAEKEMEGVVQDIQAIVGISDQTLRACRSWIRASLKD
ncbi:hypothetical protein B0H13DRAFT_2307352 [Mycena leptocephala]|nr:hypothetical protein B0H13DRAFT_2307352 [Mycena leptocephala]